MGLLAKLFGKTDTEPAPKAEGDYYSTILSNMIDRRTRIAWARFTSKDFQENAAVRPFSQHRGMDLSSTNMLMPNAFPPPYCMLLRRIMVLLDRSTSDTAMAKVDLNVFGELSVSNKVFVDFPMSLVSCRADLDELIKRESGDTGPHGLKALDPTELMTAKAHDLREPIYIAPLQHFDVRLVAKITNWAVPEFSGYVLLEGEMDHPVQ